MKEVKAIVRRNRISEVIDAIERSGMVSRAGAPGIAHVNVSTVHSLLNVHETSPTYSMELGETVVEKMRLEILCENDQVKSLVELIDRHARTGQPNAGWILVTDVVSAVAISGGHI